VEPIDTPSDGVGLFRAKLANERERLANEVTEDLDNVF